MRGGSPPRESSTSGKVAVKRGKLDHEVASALIVVVLHELRVRKAAEVIARYVIKASRVRFGKNCITIIIQPRCAMEE